MGILSELRRRNVFRALVAYAVTGWLLIEVAATVLPALQLPDWTVTLVTVLIIIGFPIALILAWAFELTPDGLARDVTTASRQSHRPPIGRRLDYVIIGLLSIALVYFVIDEFLLESQQPTVRIEASGEYAGQRAPATSAGDDLRNTVAVLPFMALSAGDEDGFFADGITEEILTALAQVPDLRVTARTSSFYFKNRSLPVPEIAARLGVANVVEGSVRRDGRKVRITVQLIRAADGFHLWSQGYDRVLDDVFAAQQDIAENIARVLGVVLDESARARMRQAGIQDVDAFISYQKGLELYTLAHREVGGAADRLAAANAYFEEVLSITPNLTLARLLRADRAGHIIRDIASGNRAEAYPGEARTVLAEFRRDYDDAWELSPPGNQRDILDLERTLFGDDWHSLPARLDKALRPGGCPQLDWTSEFIAPFGWARELGARTRETLECDPLNISANYELPFLLIWANAPDEALRAVDEAEARGLSNPRFDDARYWALLAANRTDPATTQGAGPPGSSMQFPREILQEALTGNAELSRRMAADYWNSPQANAWSSLWVAAVVGDRQRANAIATRVDAIPGGIITLAGVIFTCFCGAPFDLDAVPTYRARIGEAGFTWPPPRRIDYPTKTW